MATVKIILDKRTNRSDGTYSINIQICHNRKTTTRSTELLDWILSPFKMFDTEEEQIRLLEDGNERIGTIKLPVFIKK